MSEENEIRVNFGRAMPLFPLGAVKLMPHAVLPVHVFEPRYRQMISDALDSSGQIAMAVFEGARWKQEYHGRPPVRPAVCLGQIMEHEKLDDGRYNLRVHGVCRARILYELPAREDVLYRAAMLEPVGLEPGEDEALTPYRERWLRKLARGPLTDLTDAKGVIKHLKDDRLPPTAVMELITYVLLRDAGMRHYSEVHYELLAEGDAVKRAEIIDDALNELGGLLRRARPQAKMETPKGCSWN